MLLPVNHQITQSLNHPILPWHDFYDCQIMHNISLAFFVAALVVIAAPIKAQKNSRPSTKDTVTLPPPHATKSKMNFSKVQGWKNGRKPTVPSGFAVDLYAGKFDNPRWTYVTPNGDILVVESNSNHSLLKKIGAVIVGASKSNNLRHSADRITLLRDADKDGMPEIRQHFLTGLNQPFGMLVLNEWFYVANTDGLWRFPYHPGDLKITGAGEKVIDLPAGKHNQHWTRNIIANKEGSKIYIAVGCGSNVGDYGMESELLKANILEINPDGSDLRIYASGLRNPVGMGWAPGSDKLWTVVNERDLLGDELVPDYLTSLKEGGFYGWPYMYYGEHRDIRAKNKPAYADKTLVPDLSVGAHTASLGLAFYTDDTFPDKYHNGAFIAQHGSWNRSTLSGYKVVFVPFENGKPSGKVEDFMSFMADIKKDKVYGRPVGVTVIPDGALLITDDVNGIVWRVSVATKSISGN